MCHETLTENSQTVKSGNILKEKSGWPAILSFSVKDMVAMGTILRKCNDCILKFGSHLACLLCIKVAERHSPACTQNST